MLVMKKSCICDENRRVSDDLLFVIDVICCHLAPHSPRFPISKVKALVRVMPELHSCKDQVSS